MKMSTKISIKITCAILCLVMLCATFCACANQVKTPVLEYEGQGISLEMYEFLLSRMKGTLARNKYDVTPLSEFWSEKHPGSEKTNEEYYNDAILENCRNYLAALIIFEEEELRLTSSDIAAMEEEIAFYIDYDCKGDKKKFDAILSKLIS